MLLRNYSLQLCMPQMPTVYGTTSRRGLTNLISLECINYGQKFLSNCDEAKPYIKHLSQQRPLMFLMGLNDSYTHVRSDTFLKVIVPIVTQAYATVKYRKKVRGY